MTSTSAVLSQRDRRRNLAALIAAMTAASLIYGMTTPLLSLALENMGVESSLIGLSATAQSLIGLPMAPLVAAMMRAYGPARPILIALGLSVAAYVGFPSYPDFWAWLPLRLALGVAGAMLWITGEAWVNQVAEERTRGRVLALYSMALASGGAVGPLVLTQTGSHGWLPFLVAAAITAASALPVLWVRREAPALAGTPSTGVLGYVLLAPVPILACGLFAATDGIILAFLPLYGLRLGLDESTGLTYLVLLSVGGIIGQLPAGWLADHMDRHKLMVGAVLVLLAGTVAMPAAMTAPVFGYALFLAYGAVRGGLYTVAMAILGARFRGPDLASASAAFGVLWGLGMMAGPAMGGFALELAPRTGVPVAVGLLLLAFLPLPVIAVLRGQRA
ncbi:MAG: MFS transporter [Alphaproteobacteria bacterium]